MAQTAANREALSYAHKAGYTAGARYSAFDLPGVVFGAHRGHGSVAYKGINAGHLEFRCDGCSDTIFMLPGSGDSEEG